MPQHNSVSVEKGGKEVWVPCNDCDRKTCHKIITRVYGKLETGGDDVHEDFEVVQCQGCKTLSFLHESRYEGDMYENPITGEMTIDPVQTMYPNRIAGRPLMRGHHQLPANVLRVYEETHKALCNGLKVITGVGIRIIIEAVCNEKSAAGANLKERIDSLQTMGLITPDGAKILHSLRFMGNSGAHEIRAQSDDELNTAFEVVEYLLHGVYVLPARAASLPPAP